MQLVMAAAAISMLQAPVAPEETANVGFEELASERNAAAIRTLEADTPVDARDPARLINLGIAYAREGRFAEARAAFGAVLDHDDRMSLETANGDWVDSRRLAKRALAMLADGSFANAARFAAR